MSAKPKAQNGQAAPKKGSKAWCAKQKQMLQDAENAIPPGTGPGPGSGGVIPPAQGQGEGIIPPSGGPGGGPGTPGGQLPGMPGSQTGGPGQGGGGSPGGPSSGDPGQGGGQIGGGPVPLIEPNPIVPLPSPQEIAGTIGTAIQALGQIGNPPLPPPTDGGGAVPIHWSIGPDSAINTALGAIDQLLIEQDDALSGPMQTINETTYNVFNTTNNYITKITNKITRSGDTITTQILNSLDQVITTLNTTVQTLQMEVEFMLTQLAAKGGLIQIGQPLELAIGQEQSQTQLQYGPTIRLSCKEILPDLEDLIEVLREIRDRMPPIPLHVHGTPAAKFPGGHEDPDVTTEIEQEEMDEPTVEYAVDTTTEDHEE